MRVGAVRGGCVQFVRWQPTWLRVKAMHPPHAPDTCSSWDGVGRPVQQPGGQAAAAAAARVAAFCTAMAACWEVEGGAPGGAHAAAAGLAAPMPRPAPAPAVLALAPALVLALALALPLALSSVSGLVLACAPTLAPTLAPGAPAWLLARSMKLKQPGALLARYCSSRSSTPACSGGRRGVVMVLRAAVCCGSVLRAAVCRGDGAACRCVLAVQRQHWGPLEGA